MKKIRTTITIDANLLKMAKHHHIRISTFLDRKLQESLSEFRNNMGQWSSGYDVALTTRRSPVRFRPGPLFFLKKLRIKYINTIVSLILFRIRYENDIESHFFIYSYVIIIDNNCSSTIFNSTALSNSLF